MVAVNYGTNGCSQYSMIFQLPAADFFSIELKNRKDLRTKMCVSNKRWVEEVWVTSMRGKACTAIRNRSKGRERIFIYFSRDYDKLFMVFLSTSLFLIQSLTQKKDWCVRLLYGVKTLVLYLQHQSTPFSQALLDQHQ